MRPMLAIAAEPDHEVLTLRVQLLNADMEEDVFAKMVPSHEIADKSGRPLVMKPKKSL